MKKELIIFESLGFIGLIIFIYSIIKGFTNFNWAIGVILGLILGIYVVYFKRIIGSIIGRKHTKKGY